MDVETARLIAQTHLAEALPIRWKHVQAVGQRASELAAQLGLPDDPLVCAAWLHDVGYSPLLADCGFHPIDGARFLRRDGWPDELCNLVAHHSCAVVEAGRRGLGDVLNSEFVDRPGAERDALWTADATTGPDGRSLTVEQRVAEVVERYGPGSLVADCMLAIAPELAAASSRTMERISRRSADVGAGPLG
jgi:hypothetical protein